MSTIIICKRTTPRYWESATGTQRGQPQPVACRQEQLLQSVWCHPAPYSGCFLQARKRGETQVSSSHISLHSFTLTAHRSQRQPCRGLLHTRQLESELQFSFRAGPPWTIPVLSQNNTESDPNYRGTRDSHVLNRLINHFRRRMRHGIFKRYQCL